MGRLVLLAVLARLKLDVRLAPIRLRQEHLLKRRQQSLVLLSTTPLPTRANRTQVVQDQAQHGDVGLLVEDLATRDHRRLVDVLDLLVPLCFRHQPELLLAQESLRGILRAATLSRAWPL